MFKTDVEALTIFAHLSALLTVDGPVGPSAACLASGSKPIRTSKYAMNKRTSNLIQRCLKDIDFVISSPQVTTFLIGYTSTPEKRRRSYIGIGIPHFFVIATELDYTTALEVEQRLFELCVSDKKSRRYKKYHPEKRGNNYLRSSGGKDASGLNCCVYIACF